MSKDTITKVRVNYMDYDGGETVEYDLAIEPKDFIEYMSPSSFDIEQEDDNVVEIDCQPGDRYDLQKIIRLSSMATTEVSVIITDSEGEYIADRDFELPIGAYFFIQYLHELNIAGVRETTGEAVAYDWDGLDNLVALYTTQEDSGGVLKIVEHFQPQS